MAKLRRPGVTVVPPEWLQHGRQVRCPCAEETNLEEFWYGDIRLPDPPGVVEWMDDVNLGACNRCGSMFRVRTDP